MNEDGTPKTEDPAAMPDGGAAPVTPSTDDGGMGAPAPSTPPADDGGMGAAPAEDEGEKKPEDDAPAPM